ncbi:entericidin A/B family lipoprotein [Cobetia marina]|nr:MULTISPECIES: entericidin A/B family lipoprotein [Cobetia]POR04846.1 entericidin [Cobetia sp. MM1IDA2H-1]AOM02472.1 entericidin [Cobetia marina]MDA5562887.1 entericidin A/B family lipoprotein [Cobetia sp. MMG027]MDH2291963.1 entericidin A/B family lipoprotein [Cobetia sp. 10Alg 146]MDH2373432.1 entericidin A/B family lipoprotein [Cobetia sp. 3AK]
MRVTRLMMAALLVASVALTGCNTVAGFGKDLEHLGGKIDNAAS